MFIDEHRDRFGVEPICRTLGVSASAYYHRARGERSARELDDERLLERIRETHQANYEAYGYRRTWKALRRAGETAPRCQVQRLMRQHGIQGAKRRGKPWRTTTPDPDARRRPDLVQRNFTAEEPDRLWVGDLSYLRCWEGVVYFAFVLDVFSRRIVGWQLAGHMRTDLVLDALRMALGTRETRAPTSGSWPTPTAARNTPRPPTPRCSTTTACWRPSAASAMPTTTRWPRASSTRFKTELIADRVWRTRAQLELAVVEYVSWFNHDRLHESLGDIPPAEFEDAHTPQTRSTPPGSSPIDGAETLTHSDKKNQEPPYKPSLRQSRSGSKLDVAPSTRPSAA